MAKSKGSKWDSVGDPSEDIAVGGYDFLIKDVKVSKTGENAKTPDCKMMIAELSVLKPEEMKGTQHAEFFVLGTADDPDAEDAETLRGSRGAKAFKAFCTAAGVQMSDDDEELCEALKGEKVFGNVDAPAKEGGRKGVKGTGWFPVGEQDPEVREETKAKAKPGRPKRAVKEDEDEKPAKKKPARDDDEDEADEKPAKRRAKDEDEEEEAPKKKGRDDEDDDADEDEDERPRRKAKRDEEDEEEETERPKRGTRR